MTTNYYKISYTEHDHRQTAAHAHISAMELPKVNEGLGQGQLFTSFPLVYHG